VIEVTPLRIGFRRFEISNRQLLINGKPIVIHGVNRHDAHPLHGKVIDRETMLADIRLLKQLGFNAVRTAHYPNDPLWYDLCDEVGLYIMDEADIETHDYYDSLCRNPIWAPAFLDRVQRMVHRDKNHPCIFSWSLGNESGYGPNHDACAAWVRHVDPTRILHYEGITREEYGQGDVPFRANRGLLASDLFSPMYPRPEDMRTFVRTVQDPRPYIPCEYSHSMGNANGSLADYYEVFRNEVGVQGGFIWDWVDQGILLHKKKRAPTKKWEKPDDLEAALEECHRPGGGWYWGYGGDFGEIRHDANFCINGLVWPDRTPHPACFEFKKLAQPFELEILETHKGNFRWSNRLNFSSGGPIKAIWHLLVNGQVQAEYEPDLPTLEAGEHREIVLPIQHFKDASGEKIAELVITSADERPWCPVDHELAWSQIEFGGDCEASAATAPTVSYDDNSLIISHQGHPLLADIELNLWRACTDNDGVRKWGSQARKSLGKWKAAGYNQLVQISSTLLKHSTAEISLRQTYNVSGHPETSIHLTLTFTTQPNGLQLTADFEFPKQLPHLPRVGWKACMPDGFEALSWYGRGPHESYSDRKAGARLGCFHSTVSDQYVPYSLPQEHGNHTETRWCQIQRGDLGLRLHQVDSPFDFSASHFTAEDLFAASHTCDLWPRPETFLCADVAQTGLGNASCGPDTLPAYQLSPGRYTLQTLFQVVT
jgi:beta-galactosidase